MSFTNAIQQVYNVSSLLFLLLSYPWMLGLAPGTFKSIASNLEAKTLTTSSTFCHEMGIVH